MIVDGLSVGLFLLSATLLIVLAVLLDRREVSYWEATEQALELVRYPEHDTRRWVRRD